VQLESRVIPQFVAAQRWYAGKGAPIVSARLTDHGARENSLERWLITIFTIESHTETNQYFIPLAIAVEDGEESRWKKLQPSAIARVRQQATVGVLADACVDENFCRVVVDAIGSARELETQFGHIRALATSLYPELRGDPSMVLTVTPGSAQSSNTTVRVGEQFFLKIYRKLQPGVNPELEIGRYLTEVAHFPNIVPVAGAVEYRSHDGTVMTLALLQAFVMNQGDGWDYTVNYLVRFLEDRPHRRTTARGRARPIPGPDEDACHQDGRVARRAIQTELGSRLLAGADHHERHRDLALPCACGSRENARPACKQHRATVA